MQGFALRLFAYYFRNLFQTNYEKTVRTPGFGIGSGQH